MAEYIELEKAIEAFTFADADVCQEYGDYECEFGFSREAIKDVLKSVETEDVAPVVHGKWILKETVHIGLKEYMCSECTDDEYWEKYYCRGNEKFCPNCGAKMNL